jgi:hypothetical protein
MAERSLISERPSYFSSERILMEIAVIQVLRGLDLVVTILVYHMG